MVAPRCPQALGTEAGGQAQEEAGVGALGCGRVLPTAIHTCGATSGGTEADTCRRNTRRGLEGPRCQPRGLQQLGQTHRVDVPQSPQPPTPSLQTPQDGQNKPPPRAHTPQGPRAAGRGLAGHRRQKPHIKQDQVHVQGGVRLPREASASSPWPSRPLHTQETSGTSVACSDPPKEKLMGQLGQL